MAPLEAVLVGGKRKEKQRMLLVKSNGLGIESILESLLEQLDEFPSCINLPQSIY